MKYTGGCHEVTFLAVQKGYFVQSMSITVCLHLSMKQANEEAGCPFVVKIERKRLRCGRANSPMLWRSKKPGGQAIPNPTLPNPKPTPLPTIARVHHPVYRLKWQLFKAVMVRKVRA
jgi:hypothetical protein